MELATTLAGFLIMGVFCTALEGLWPEKPRQVRWRPDSWIDAFYVGMRITMSVALILLTAGVGRAMPAPADGPITRQPVVLQILEILLLTDLLSYAVHWVLHRSRGLWPIHAIHHSAEEIDWLVAARNHPLEPVLFKVLMNYPLYLIGFRADLMAAVMPFVATYSLLLHANLTWDYGPLGYVLASPAFHRWHHSSEAKAIDKNFAQLFSFYDFLFGTAYFPRGEHSQQYGLNREFLPVGIWSHVSYPFRRWWGMLAGAIERRPPATPATEEEAAGYRPAAATDGRKVEASFQATPD